MAEFLQMLLQGLITLLLGVFGFSWDMPEKQKKEDDIKAAIVRLHLVEPVRNLLQPMQNFEFYRPDSKANCSNKNIKLKSLEVPLFIETKNQPFSS